MPFTEIFSASVLLLLVIDPFGNVAIVIAALAGVPAPRRVRVVLRECFVAYAVLLAFMLGGQLFLRWLQLSEVSLAIAGGIYWLIGRHPATLVTAKQAAATGAILLAVCALADLAAGYPYQGVLFLLGAAALAVAFVLLQQGMVPVELRFGSVTAFAASSGIIQLRMLEELRDAGILTPEEFAAKRVLIAL